MLQGSARTPTKVRDVADAEATFGSEGIECYFGRNERSEFAHKRGELPCQVSKIVCVTIG